MRITTVKQVVELLRSPECVSFSCYRHSSIDRRKLSHIDYFDILVDYGTERRLSIKVSYYAHSTYIDVTELTGYDPKKHAWTLEGMKYRTVDEEPNFKRRRVVLNNFRKSLWDNRKWDAHGDPHRFSASKRKDWEIY